MLRSSLNQLVLSNRWPDRLARHSVFWLGCVGFFTLLYGTQIKVPASTGFVLWISFLQALLFLPVHIFLSYGIIYFLFPRYLYTHRYVELFIGTVLFVLAAALLNVGVATFVIGPIRQWLGIGPPTSDLFYAFMAGLRGSNTVAGFAAAIRLGKDWYLKNVEARRLEHLRLETELRLLRSQLHPHFIFNAMNSIYSLALLKSDRTPAAILRLSELLRYLANETNEAEVSLAHEVTTLCAYLDIQKLRFGDRLDISFNVSGPLERYGVPPLVLLSILENSFKHGANEAAERPWVSFDLQVANHELVLKVINGKSMLAGSKGRSTPNIGQKNIRKQLELMYPQRHELVVSETDDDYTVNLRIQIPEKEILPSHEKAAVLVG